MTSIESEIDKIPDKTTKNDYKCVQGSQGKQKAPDGKHRQLNGLKKVIQDIKDEFM